MLGAGRACPAELVLQTRRNNKRQSPVLACALWRDFMLKRSGRASLYASAHKRCAAHDLESEGQDAKSPQGGL
jgi:hypothetical protein